MPKIGEQTAFKMATMLQSLINDHREEISEAYRKTEDALSISFSVKIKPSPQGNFIEAGINFVESRCKDTIQDAVDEDQIAMFEGGEAA